MGNVWVEVDGDVTVVADDVDAGVVVSVLAVLSVVCVVELTVVPEVVVPVPRENELKNMSCQY